MSHTIGGHDDGSEPASAFLFFPYFSGDDGTRPLPASAVGYACPSLLVDGAPYAWSNLSPGATIALSATVTNLGDVLAYGLVTFRWAEPTAQFTQDLSPVGQVGDVWLPGETKTTQTVTWIVPVDIPSHACLLAEIDSPLDPVPAPAPLTTSDRHYAQQNLIFLTLGPGEGRRVSVRAGNPGVQAMTFRITVSTDVGRAAAELARTRQSPLNIKAAASLQPRLLGSAPDRWLPVRLEPRSSQAIELEVEAPMELRPGEMILLRIEQRQEQRPHDVVGSIGVAIVGRR